MTCCDDLYLLECGHEIRLPHVHGPAVTYREFHDCSLCGTIRQATGRLPEVATEVEHEQLAE